MTRKLYLLISLLWCFLTTAPIFAGNTHSHSRLIALDVKEGQSILLQHNNRGLLFDTGHAGEALNLLKN